MVRNDRREDNGDYLCASYVEVTHLFCLFEKGYSDFQSIIYIPALSYRLQVAVPPSTTEKVIILV